MTDKTTPAFPVHEQHMATGLTMRDYFAAKAMQAMMSNDTHMRTAATNSKGQPGMEFLAIASYEAADAMLRAREGV